MKLFLSIAALAFTATASAAVTAPTTPVVAPAASAAPVDVLQVLGAKILLLCAVPVTNAQPSYLMTIAVTTDAASDFLILKIDNADGESLMESKIDKGAAQAALLKGSMFEVMTTEQTSQDTSGLIHSAGIMIIQSDSKGGLGGLLSANGGLYPLICKTPGAAAAALIAPTQPAPPQKLPAPVAPHAP